MLSKPPPTDLCGLCGLKRSYVFVSYSSADSLLVFRDMLELQRRGYNLWLGEKNLDTSWVNICW